MTKINLTMLLLLVAATILAIIGASLYSQTLSQKQTIQTLSKQPIRYSVAEYVAYYGPWTILHIQDKNRINPQVNFYLAYNIHTHETRTSQDYKELIKELTPN